MREKSEVRHDIVEEEESCEHDDTQSEHTATPVGQSRDHDQDRPMQMEMEEPVVQEMSLIGNAILLLLLWYLITNRESFRSWADKNHIWKSARAFVLRHLKNWSNRRRDRFVKENTILELDLEYARISDRKQRISTVFGPNLLQPPRVIWYRTLVKSLDTAAKDDKVKAIIVRLGDTSVNHVGLSVIEELRDALLKFRKSGKVAIVHAETIGELSNGTNSFLFACAFDTIMVAKMGLICTPGLSMSSIFVKNLLQKLDIDAEWFSRDERYKTFPNMFTKDKLTKEHREEMEKLLRGISKVITSEIASSRSVDIKRVNQWFDTAVWFPEDANSAGMIDFTVENGRDDAQKEILKRLVVAREDANFLFLQKYADVADRRKAMHDWSSTPSKKMRKATAALIHLQGNVIRGEQTVSAYGREANGIYSENVSRLIRSISAEGKTKAVVLRINSGGGSGTAANIITREIDLARSKGIKFYAQIGDTCASAAYQIAMHCDTIIVNRTSITGSIGAILGKFNIGGTLEQIGVNVDILNSHENSDLFSATKPLTKHQQETLEAALDRVYKQFVDDVAKNRKMSEEEVNKVSGGRVFLGEEAKELGLVDKIGTLSDTLDMVKKDLGLEEKDKLDIKTMPKDTMGFLRMFDRPKNDEEKDKLFAKNTASFMPGNTIGHIGNIAKLGQHAGRVNHWLDRTIGQRSNMHLSSAFSNPFRKPPGNSAREYSTRALKQVMRCTVLRR